MEEKILIVNRDKNISLTKKEIKDLNILRRFIELFCKRHHLEIEKTDYSCKNMKVLTLSNNNLKLCKECTELLDYAIDRRIKCPLDPKPMCKKCPVHCYRKDYRKKIQEIMKDSGIAMIKRGRLDMIYHYFF